MERDTREPLSNLKYPGSKKTQRAFVLGDAQFSSSRRLSRDGISHGEKGVGSGDRSESLVSYAHIVRKAFFAFSAFASGICMLQRIL